MITLGCLDISTKVFLMSRCLAQSRVDHMIQVMHIFPYLKYNEYIDLTYDATKLDIHEKTALPHETTAYKAGMMKNISQLN